MDNIEQYRMDTIENQSQLLSFFEKHSSLEIYAVINGASFDYFERTLYENEPDPQFRSLFMGTDHQELRNFVPYLVKLSLDSSFLQYLNSLEHQSWGYFALSSYDFDSVFEHYQSALFASCPEHEQVYFFFYQPEIAYAYYKEAVKEQLSHFMGPVKYLLLPNYDIFLLNENHPYAYSIQNPVFEPRKNLITKVVISNNQLKAFETVTEKEFTRKMISHLSSLSLAYHHWMLEQKVNFIKYGIEHSKKYNITSHSNIENYLELMLTYGYQFDETQTNWAVNILNNNELKGSEKISQLLASDAAIARMSIEMVETV